MFMKTYLVPILFLVPLFWNLNNSLSAQVNSKIHPELWSKIQENPGAYHKAYIHLKEQVDVDQMKQTFDTQRMQAEQRAQVLFSELKETATTTQIPVLSKLNIRSSSYKPERLRALWLTNTIYIEAKEELLMEVSGWEEIEGIYPEIVASTQHEVAIESASFVPNGKEPGLVAIGAPEMWAKGYTGYGRKAVIFDSGEDWEHPAIKEQFYGLYVPVEKAWSAPASVPFDVGGHGTHVTGTICGLDRMRNDTIGVAFNAMWIGAPVQFNNSPPQPLPVLDFLSNMEFAVDPNGDLTDLPDVINNSWSGGSWGECSPFAPFAQAVRAGEASGIAIVWAAGNAGPEPSTVRGYQTSNFDLVAGFSVGATSWSNPYNIADFSSRGPSLCGGSGSLAIKPEVSAPGVSVRSSVLNGSYSNYNGTSMASPHVAGAVLLLKEAFPYLTGEEILLAMYFTAIDLGQPGEDNEYGMGIIHIPSAFDYLVAEGHVPVPPPSVENDLIIVGVRSENNLKCGVSPSWELIVENGGAVQLTHFNIFVEATHKNGVCRFEQSWDGLIEPGMRSTIELDLSSCDFVNATGNYYSGSYEISIHVDMPNGQPDDRDLNNRSRINLTQPVDVPIHAVTRGFDEATGCLNSRILLETNYTGPGQIEWYNQAIGGDAFHTGSTYLTPPLGKSITYYTKTVLKHFGKVDYEGDEFSNIEPESGNQLFFDVHESLVLKSVAVYTLRQGILAFAVCSPTGNCTTINKIIRPGKNIIDVNVDLSPGLGWRIEKTSQNITPIYSLTGTDFPYDYKDLITITGSDHPDNAYLYFYDWELAYALECDRTPINLNIRPVFETPESAFTAPDTINIAKGEMFLPNLVSENASAWFWDFGDGFSSQLQSPVHEYTKAGTYAVTLQIKTSDGCTDGNTRTIVVIDEEISTSTDPIMTHSRLLKAFPNPAKTTVMLEFEGLSEKQVQINLVDLFGKTVLHADIPLDAYGRTELKLSNLLPGIYQLIGFTDTEAYTGRVLIVE
jgi:subtilisin family serine protease